MPSSFDPVLPQKFERFAGGIWNTQNATSPDPARVETAAKKLGFDCEVTVNASGALVLSANDLTLDTVLETKEHGDITGHEAMEFAKTGKLRCQSPFRESSSWAAFFALSPQGKPFVFDVGSGTHWLNEADWGKLLMGEPEPLPDDVSTDADDSPPERALDPVASLAENIIVFDVVENPFDTLPHFVDMWIPADEVTLLAGHGGGGKSYVALSLAVHVALGHPFGALTTTQANVLFFSGEDGAKVLRQRLARICRALKIDSAELDGKLYLLDASDIDPALHREQKVSVRGRQQIITETLLLDALSGLVKKLDAGLVIVDNASDAYDDDEIKRARVRAFVRSLRSRIARPGRAVLLLAHINKASAIGGRGAGSEDYSGSTAWHNSVRSRLSLIPDGDDALKIEHLKANLGAKYAPVRLEWHDGVPLVAGSYTNLGGDAQNAIVKAAQKALDDEHKAALVILVQDFDRRGERVTTAFQGSATVFKLLKGQPGFPKGTNSERLMLLLRALETEGRVFRRTVRTPDRKLKETFTCRMEGAPIPAKSSADTFLENGEECANALA